jgi:thiamine biosynthesis protein ThiI
METVSHVLATFHEVALKKGNRGFFERALLRNIRTALAGLPAAEISIPSRVVIRFAEPIAWTRVHPRLATVFGLNNLIPVARVGTTWEQLERHVSERLADLPGASFAVRCQRSDKRFPLTSVEVSVQLGALVKNATGKRVDLTKPEVTLGVMIQNDGIYFYRDRYPGPGGLPVGTSGRVLVLLSGGIDSPVAGYLAMKRGIRAHFVHFHSAPFTADASVRKVREVVRELGRYQGAARLAVVPFGECQQQIVTSCPERLRVVLYRRMMVRTAERIARRWRCAALVTGESLNQVASQTLDNITTIDRVAHMPVLRPVVTFDKDEIVQLAERVHTYEISILPHQDCCSFLQPQHPATKTSCQECEAAEETLDVESWARRLQHEAEVEMIAPRAWE